jgi:hypothetical protein
MPTRIVLDVPDTTVASVSPRSRVPGRLPDVENPPRGGAPTPTQRRPLNPNPNPISAKASSRKIVKFRSTMTILRAPPLEEEKAEDKRGLSTTDIRASPRLVGYVYQLLASLIMLITVVQFYKNSQDDADETVFKVNIDSLRTTDNWRIFESVNGPVYFWKLVGCAIAGSVGAVINLFVVMAHFDTVCLPRLWNAVFRDGSKYEQNFLRLLLIFWVGALHICTSSLSVGEVQGNVFFTAWIAFIACVLNYGVWRTSAGFPSLAERASSHHRETTYNWLWMTFFEFMNACAATDKFFNKENIILRIKGEVLILSRRDWIVILGVIWGFVAVSIIALLLNHYATQSVVINLCGGRNQVYLGWRQAEGIVILGMLSVFFWIIYKHTGVDGIVNGLSNDYIGIWGSFFNCVFLLGTWLRENKNIEYIVGNRRREEQA